MNWKDRYVSYNTPGEQSQSRAQQVQQAGKNSNTKQFDRIVQTAKENHIKYTTK